MIARSARRPSVAVVGIGLMGRWHLATARALGAPVVGLVERDAARASASARRFRVPAFDGLEGLLERARPQVVHLCTPLASHAPLASTLVDAGCHVICEKPLAATGDEVEALLARARSAGRSVCPVHQFALQQATCDALAGLGRIGALRRIAFTFYSAGGAGHPSDALDEILLDILPHPLSVLARVDPARRLASVDWSVYHPAAGEACVQGRLGDAAVSIDLSLSARPTEASARVVGTEGSIELDFFHGYAVFRDGRVSRLDKALQPFRASGRRLGAAAANLAGRAVRRELAYPGLRNLLDACYQRATDAQAAPFGDDEVVDIYRARDALAAALRRRHPRSLP